MIKINYNEIESMGKRIYQKRKELKLTQREFELLCGWKGDGSRICNYERDIREPDIEDTKTMAAILKVTPWYLAYGITLDGEKNDIEMKDFKQEISDRKIPIILLEEVESWMNGKITNQNTKRNFMQIDKITVIGKEELCANRFLKFEGSFCVEISGDAMVSPINPINSYLPGELAIINTQLVPKEGDVVIFSHKNSVKIRQISKDGTENVLTAFNPQYPVIMMDDEVRIFGLIISTERKRYKP